MHRTASVWVKDHPLGIVERQSTPWPYLVASFTSFLLILDFTLQSYFASNPSSLPLSPPEYCPTSKPCPRTPLFTFQLTCILPILITSLYGLTTYLNLPTFSNTTPTARVYGYSYQSQILVSFNLSFQIYDFLASLSLPEHFTLIPMIHHTLAGTVLLLCLKNQTLNYYSPFFAGVTELSTVPLVLLDLDKFFIFTNPLMLQSIEYAKPAFALTFLYIRVFMWFKNWTPRLVADVMYVRNMGDQKELRPGQDYVLWIFMFCNVGLGMMQIWWAWKIVNIIAKVAIGGNDEL